MTKRILVDMDGVLADFEKGFIEKWQLKHPHRQTITLEDRTIFHIEDQYPEDWRKDVRAVTQAKNFFFELEPLKGGIEALTELAAEGNKVTIYIQIPICHSFSI